MGLPSGCENQGRRETITLVMVRLVEGVAGQFTIAMMRDMVSPESFGSRKLIIERIIAAQRSNACWNVIGMDIHSRPHTLSQYDFTMRVDEEPFTAGP